MSISESTFHDIFHVVQKVVETHPDTLALDPIADLNAKPLIRIPYTRKPKLNASSAFMTIKKSQKNWIGLLLVELQHMTTGMPADNLIMRGKAGAKSTKKRQKQAWCEFVVELYDDKIKNRNDISEAQAKQLVALIAELSANGHKLKGCGTLEFIDETGEVLA